MVLRSKAEDSYKNIRLPFLYSPSKPPLRNFYIILGFKKCMACGPFREETCNAGTISWMIGEQSNVFVLGQGEEGGREWKGCGGEGSKQKQERS